MRHTLPIIALIFLGGCAYFRHGELASLAADSKVLADAIQATDDIGQAHTYASGVSACADALHGALDPSAKSSITEAEAMANPERAVGVVIGNARLTQETTQWWDRMSELGSGFLVELLGSSWATGGTGVGLVGLIAAMFMRLRKMNSVAEDAIRFGQDAKHALESKDEIAAKNLVENNEKRQMTKGTKTVIDRIRLGLK